MTLVPELNRSVFTQRFINLYLKLLHQNATYDKNSDFIQLSHTTFFLSPHPVIY